MSKANGCVPTLSTLSPCAYELYESLQSVLKSSNISIYSKCRLGLFRMDARTAPRTAAMDTFRWGSGWGGASLWEREHNNNNGLFRNFSFPYHVSYLSPSLWETTRYRLKYCLKSLQTQNNQTVLQYWGTHHIFHVEGRQTIVVVLPKLSTCAELEQCIYK